MLLPTLPPSQAHTAHRAWKQHYPHPRRGQGRCRLVRHFHHRRWVRWSILPLCRRPWFRL